MARFYGDDYDPERDKARLTKQMDRVRIAMQQYADVGRHISVREIAEITGDPACSILAQIGNLKKAENGQYDIKRKSSSEKGVSYEYLLGERGAGVLKVHRCKRIAQLEEALSALNPDHPLLIDRED